MFTYDFQLVEYAIDVMYEYSNPFVRTGSPSISTELKDLTDVSMMVEVFSKHYHTYDPIGSKGYR